MALAIALKAKYVLLDGPLKGLDPSRRVKMLKAVAGETESTVVLVTHETRVLRILGEWTVYLLFEGRAYGPIEASKLSSAGVVRGRDAKALITVESGQGVFSIVPSGGKSVTELLSLDKVYEILAEV
ncbi:MAG: hypothetical protein DRO13_03100 [Thermoprotei archaeon]|nr:MAG: hypothetical protein DRO13_03100 [Thermoprotei archaeon]